MKIVVIGGSGLIGTKLCKILRDQGHEVLPASRSTGVDTQTGEGLANALAGADVVVDVANAPSWEDQAVLDFFETAGRNIHAAEASARIGHHVALSVVGTDRMLTAGYFRAKMAQEKLIKASGIPYTIVRPRSSSSLSAASSSRGADGQTIRLPPAKMQPMAGDDVAALVADAAVAKPLNGTIDIAGPEPIGMDDLARQFLAAKQDSRQVTTDPTATYFGTPVDDQSLSPLGEARLGPTRFSDWLARTK